MWETVWLTALGIVEAIVWETVWSIVSEIV